ncbi:MAG: hypothetical protein HY444_07760 [Nitrospirae bacterium]|nr:hypothetical protein [Nitrospirota bacterium]
MTATTVSGALGRTPADGFFALTGWGFLGGDFLAGLLAEDFFFALVFPGMRAALLP